MRAHTLRFSPQRTHRIGNSKLNPSEGEEFLPAESELDSPECGYLMQRRSGEAERVGDSQVR